MAKRLKGVKNMCKIKEIKDNYGDVVVEVIENKHTTYIYNKKAGTETIEFKEGCPDEIIKNIAALKKQKTNGKIITDSAVDKALYALKDEINALAYTGQIREVIKRRLSAKVAEVIKAWQNEK